MPLPLSFWEDAPVGSVPTSLPEPSRNGQVIDWYLLGSVDVPIGHPVVLGTSNIRIGVVTATQKAPGAFGGFTGLRAEIDCQITPSIDALLQLEPVIEQDAVFLIAVPVEQSRLM